MKKVFLVLSVLASLQVTTQVSAQPSPGPRPSSPFRCTVSRATVFGSQILGRMTVQTTQSEQKVVVAPGGDSVTCLSSVVRGKPSLFSCLIVDANQEVYWLPENARVPAHQVARDPLSRAMLAGPPSKDSEKVPPLGGRTLLLRDLRTREISFPRVPQAITVVSSPSIGLSFPSVDLKSVLSVNCIH